MDPRALWVSATFAAAKLAVALWFGQLALSVLDRRRVTLAWQIALAVATLVLSWWAVRTSGVPAWWGPTWVTSSLLAAAALVECVRRWLAGSSTSDRAEIARSVVGRNQTLAFEETQRIHSFIAVIGLTASAAASAGGVLGQLANSGWLIRIAAVTQMLTCAGLLGVVLAASFELTIGATGTALLKLHWRRLGRLASVALLIQLLVSTLVIVLRQSAVTPAESAMPILFALGMVIVGYIVWAIPRRMLSLALKERMDGQASLALAAWLAVICLAIACGLPPSWPWKQLKNPSAGLSVPILRS